MTSPRTALLIDFGSTFTKLRVADLDSGHLIAAAQSPSTVETSVMDGLQLGLVEIRRQLGAVSLAPQLKLASSSAAGGLRIVSVGLVRDLTAEAAKRAGLGAGGKVVGAFANGLNSEDIDELASLAPDVIILAGGTDGGNRDCIIENARAIAQSGTRCPIVVAGNRNARQEVAAIFEQVDDISFVIVDNVLPRIDEINVRSCSEAIRAIFMERIVQSKGLSEVENFVGRILMPTPHAVLLGFELLARGTDDREGLGELVAIDVGGATTDVYSIATGQPRERNTAVRGLPEPFVKRTVEGDLGLRINAGSIIASAGSAFLDGLSAAVDMAAHAEQLRSDTTFLPESDAGRHIDIALAREAAGIALRRHAGTVEVAYGPEGPFSIQVGKDLREIKTIIGTGGIFTAHPSEAAELFAGSLYDTQWPTHLLPSAPACLVDKDYVMFAAGLLSVPEPDAALALAFASLDQPSAGGLS